MLPGDHDDMLAAAEIAQRYFRPTTINLRISSNAQALLSAVVFDDGRDVRLRGILAMLQAAAVHPLPDGVSELVLCTVVAVLSA